MNSEFAVHCPVCGSSCLINESQLGSILSCALCSREFVAEKPGEEASGKVQKFDWIGFQVRFACGAFLGALMGWKSWAKAHYRQNFEHDGISLCVCMLIGALLMGTIVGFGWRENFWSRPL